MPNTQSRIESEEDIEAYIQNLQYALKHNAKIKFQEKRIVDERRNIRYTNKFTIADLFPNENPVTALKRELQTLAVKNYIKTVKDLTFPNRSEMREFGKMYNNQDVYIKIRVELLSLNGEDSVFVMSFHYAETPFTYDMFPYTKKKE